MPLWLTPPLQGLEARRQTTGFDGLTGQFRQIAKNSRLLHGAGLRLGSKCFDLLLEQVDDVLGSLQLPTRRCLWLTQRSRQSIHEVFHSSDAIFEHRFSSFLRQTV
jgi:hypothetical protein